VICHADSRCPTAEADIAGLSGVQFIETVQPAMKKIPNSSRNLNEHILRALNKIRKPSTASEITSCSIVTWTSMTALFKQKMSRSGCETPRTQR
jgi:hypothetical protein